MDQQPQQSQPSVVFTDDSGQDKEMLIICTFAVEDQSYAVLIEKDRPDSDGVMMKVEQSEDDAYLAPIEDDDEWDRALNVYEKLADDEN